MKNKYIPTRPRNTAAISEGNANNMMYTPTPATRRFQPPSRSQPAQISGKAQSTASNLNSRPPPSPSLSTSSLSSTVNTVSQSQERSRGDSDKLELSPISSNIADQEGEEEKGSQKESRKLDSHGSLPTGLKRRSLGIGLPPPLVSIENSSLVETGGMNPSPPPPYGSTLLSPSTSSEIHQAPTPLRQDSGPFSNQSIHSSGGSSGHAERSRIERATNAARAVGLEVDFGTSGSESQEWITDVAESASTETLRAQFLAMKRQLKRRDSGT